MGNARLLGALVAVNVALVAVGHAIAPARRQAPATDVTIGLVFDVGGKDDRSFNDAAFRGLERARRELGVGVIEIEPSDGASREAGLRQLAARKVDLVIGVGFIFSNDLEKLAAEFPSVQFAGVDFSPSEGKPVPPNLVGLRFREHEGSFVVGAIAGLSTRSRIVGFVGGMKIPLIRKFEVGYAAGVAHTCPTCRVLSAYAGTEPSAFSNPNLGQELASSQYDRGADVVFHASGKTGAGVFAAARARRKLAIGVDSDQFGVAPCCVLTSMIKKVDVAVYDLIAEVAAGQWHGGLRELGLAEGGVGFVSDEHNALLLPPAVAQRARAIAEQIIRGEIVVPSR